MKTSELESDELDQAVTRARGGASEHGQDRMNNDVEAALLAARKAIVWSCVSVVFSLVTLVGLYLDWWT